MFKDKWKVVRLYRNKKADIISTHWWHWTACYAAALHAERVPTGTFDVWKIV